MGKYFGLGDDWEELTGSYRSGGDRAAAGLKLLGKGLFNVGKFAVTEVVPGMVSQAGKRAEEHLDKNRGSMSSEQIARAEELSESGRQVRERHEKIRDIDWKITDLESQIKALPEGDYRREELENQIENLRESRPSSAFRD
ncbi:hypothetical protein KDX27_07550 [Burkholderia cenocepacia]|jgi:hypothetical protein|uniref:Uncharacterized protein n=1 Tax=Burkholderia cenocepacia TaxID=95486 RepID=A0ABD4U8U7_9BURK|nr:hypothetical protein [Burkholderia cenocepacia]AIO45628.1 hypothetical protein DM42_4675 [Burkholderia cepacia]KGC02245.1 hypothetical protein DM44_5450 [Burkholderia cepacia]MBJ9697793.1 hypothetical protein [Burkholderia cenocepacia]MBN3530362.1 hypothetical protein [Burkholderia cenocepacia]MBO1855778.1 hypothetical protein [Burkholderia cenocepacia]